MNQSPYAGAEKSQWKSITEQLIKQHPLSEHSIVEMVFAA